MDARRPTNSELRLQRLEEEHAGEDEPRGIFELFEPDEDARLDRDDD